MTSKLYMPKSIRTALPDPSTMMFPGLMSRWRRLWPCTYRRAKPVQGLRLLDELPPELGKQLFLAFCRHTDLRRVAVTVAEVSVEELLDSDTLLHDCMDRLVRAAEATAADEADYTVTTAVKKRPRTQMMT